MDSPEKLKEALLQSLDEAEWTWLKPHAQRDAVVLVHATLDMVDVAERIAIDDSRQVEAWVAKGLLTKPTAEQIRSWDEVPDRKFLSLVVQPYVLAQERHLH